MHCFLQHPFKSDFGEPALCFWIATADIAMDARKPDLLEIRRPAINFRMPKVGAEERPPLINRDSVTPDLNVGAIVAVG
jgi:hypothetical protein